MLVFKAGFSVFAFRVLPFFFLSLFSCQAAREKEAVRVFQAVFQMNTWRKRKDLPVRTRQYQPLFICFEKKIVFIKVIVFNCFQGFSFAPKLQAKSSTRGESRFFWRSSLQHFTTSTCTQSCRNEKKCLQLIPLLCPVFLCNLSLFPCRGCYPSSKSLLDPWKPGASSCSSSSSPSPLGEALQAAHFYMLLRADKTEPLQLIFSNKNSV